MRAPGHPQGCFLTEILMDELADRVKMDPVEFRIKNLPPDAPNAMWTEYLPSAARSCSAGTSGIRPAIRRPGRSRPAWACSAHRWGGGGRGIAGALRHHVRRQRRHEVRHAGHRHRHAHDRRDGRGRNARACRSSAVKAEIGDTHLSVQRRVGRQHDGGVGVAGHSRHVGQGARRAVRESRADARRRRRRTLVAAGGRIHVKGNPSKGLAWKDACKLLGTEPISVDGTVGGRAVGQRHERRAVRRSHGRHRDRHREGRRASSRSRTAG